MRGNNHGAFPWSVLLVCTAVFNFVFFCFGRMYIKTIHGTNTSYVGPCSGLQDRFHAQHRSHRTNDSHSGPACQKNQSRVSVQKRRWCWGPDPRKLIKKTMCGTARDISSSVDRDVAHGDIVDGAVYDDQVIKCNRKNCSSSLERFIPPAPSLGGHLRGVQEPRMRRGRRVVARVARVSNV